MGHPLSWSGLPGPGCSWSELEVVFHKEKKRKRKRLCRRIEKKWNNNYFSRCTRGSSGLGSLQVKQQKRKDGAGRGQRKENKAEGRDQGGGRSREEAGGQPSPLGSQALMSPQRAQGSGWSPGVRAQVVTVQLLRQVRGEQGGCPGFQQAVCSRAICKLKPSA